MKNACREIFRKFIPLSFRKKIKKLYDLLYRKVCKKTYYHKQLYYRFHQKELNLKNPITFDEKIHYLILKKYGKKEARLTDKHLVKKYIKNLNIKDLYVPKTLATYRSSKEIDISKLPTKFVLKCNHWSGDVFICTNKETFNLDNAARKLDEIMQKSYSDTWGEYHYKFIKPLIIAEEYLDDSKNLNPIDYKFYCSYGKAFSVLVCSEREQGTKLSEYDMNFKEIDCIKKEYKPTTKISKPKNFKKMVKIAQELSINIPFARVDLYEVNNKIYFGEYTFTPAAGYCYQYDETNQIEHGKYINLKKDKKR